MTTARLPRLKSPFAWRTEDELAWIEFALVGAGGAFSTRAGGVSGGAFASLNLGNIIGDEATNVAANRERICQAVGRSGAGLVWGRQRHSSEVLEVSQPAQPGRDPSDLEPVDGFAISSRDLTLLVLAADCLPLALAADGAVAMLHCGWRGLSQGIIERGVEALAQAADCERSQITAVIGPGIGPCCYEVGKDVIDAMSSRGHSADVHQDGFLDLPLIASRELQKADVVETQIFTVGLCTVCWFGLFYSHRRDRGETGRQCGMVWRV